MFVGNFYYEFAIKQFNHTRLQSNHIFRGSTIPGNLRKIVFVTILLLSFAFRLSAPSRESLIILDSRPVEPYKRLIHAIGMVETRNDTLAYNPVEAAAFGVRNFSDPLKGLTEMKRVIREKGMIIVLEFSKPSGFPFRPVYNFYFRNILPVFGKLFSKDKRAYMYLPDSVMKFPDNEEFLELLTLAGFSDTRQIKLTGGVASIYTGVKFSKQ